MKSIVLISDDKVKSLDVFRAALEAPPVNGGLNIEEIRKRLRVLDVLDKCDGESLILEDADFDTLRVAFDQVKWLKVSKEIVRVADSLTAT